MNKGENLEDLIDNKGNNERLMDNEVKWNDHMVKTGIMDGNYS